MKLTLDHTQRLNLHALLGAQRAAVGSIRAIWAIQDRIALDPDEEQALDVKREMVAGQERVVWNPALSILAKDFEFTDPEVARIKAALQTWDAYGAAADRRWLQPLVIGLFSYSLASGQTAARRFPPATQARRQLDNITGINTGLLGRLPPPRWRYSVCKSGITRPEDPGIVLEIAT